MSNKEFKVRPLFIPEKKIALLTNGKCGGTSLHRWFFMLLEPPLLERSFFDVAKSFTLRFALELVAVKNFKKRILVSDSDKDFRRFVSIYRRSVCEKYVEEVGRDDVVKIMVVRDPVKRCLSAYKDKFCGEDSSSGFVKEVVRFFPCSRNGISFHQFIQYLESTDNDKCNGHWRRQTFFSDHVPGDIKMIRLEHFDFDLKSLGLIKNPPELPVRNVANKGVSKSPEVEAAHDMPSEDLVSFKRRHGALPEDKCFLTESLVMRIREIYKKDYEVLPYE